MTIKDQFITVFGDLYNNETLVKISNITSVSTRGDKNESNQYKAHISLINGNHVNTRESFDDVKRLIGNALHKVETK